MWGKTSAHDEDIRTHFRSPTHPTEQVFKATEKATGKEFAIKVLNKRHIVRENKVQYVQVERAVLSRLNFPFFVFLYYTFQDANSLCMPAPY